MLKRFGAAALQLIESAQVECQRLGNSAINTAHILLALSLDTNSVAGQALFSLGVQSKNILSEIGRLDFGNELGDVGTAASARAGQGRSFSGLAHEAILRAQDQSRFFGLAEVSPEQLLLGIIDLPDCAASLVLEELGANVAFLKRQVIYFMARHCSAKQSAPSLRTSLIVGLTDLIDNNLAAAQNLSKLSVKSAMATNAFPDRRKIVHMVFLGYMPELLSIQIAFQRHLLQETLKILEQRSGQLEKELTASIVSNSAQHLRLEVRSTIEYLWSNEYRLFEQMLNEAEHDLIGSVIEDLWWAQSEEIALHDLFDEALVDHRRKQILNLQKKRVEIAQRIGKLQIRLAQTIQQCFSKNMLSARN